MSLEKAKVAEKTKHMSKANVQLYIVSGCGENNLLVETESAQSAQDWIVYIRQHAEYASSMKIHNSVVLK